MTEPDSTSCDVDAKQLIRLATAHLARYAASSAGLRMVLERKLRRRCVRLGLEPPDDNRLSATLDGVIDTLLKAGLLDDAAVARSRMRRLVHKGLPTARIRYDLQANGLPFDDETAGIDVDDETQARRFATRKRLGPYRTGSRPESRDKDIRAMVRAGFGPRLAMSIIDAAGSDDDDREQSSDA